MSDDELPTPPGLEGLAMTGGEKEELELEQRAAKAAKFILKYYHAIARSSVYQGGIWGMKDLSGYAAYTWYFPLAGYPEGFADRVVEQLRILGIEAKSSVDQSGVPLVVVDSIPLLPEDRDSIYSMYRRRPGVHVRGHRRRT